MSSALDGYTFLAAPDSESISHPVGLCSVTRNLLSGGMNQGASVCDWKFTSVFGLLSCRKQFDSEIYLASITVVICKHDEATLSVTSEVSSQHIHNSRNSYRTKKTLYSGQIHRVSSFAMTNFNIKIISDVICPFVSETPRRSDCV